MISNFEFPPRASHYIYIYVYPSIAEKNKSLIDFQRSQFASIRRSNAHRLRERWRDVIYRHGRPYLSGGNAITEEDNRERYIRRAHQLIFVRVCIHVAPARSHLNINVAREARVIPIAHLVYARRPCALQQTL